MMRSHVSGIPCLINITRCDIADPDRNTWDSDYDYAGHCEIEFTVHDLMGDRATWIEGRMDDEDEARIKGEILKSGDID